MKGQKLTCGWAKQFIASFHSICIRLTMGVHPHHKSIYMTWSYDLYSKKENFRWCTHYLKWPCTGSTESYGQCQSSKFAMQRAISCEFTVKRDLRTTMHRCCCYHGWTKEGSSGKAVACAWDWLLSAPTLLGSAFPTSPARPGIHRSVHHHVVLVAQHLKQDEPLINGRKLQWLRIELFADTRYNQGGSLVPNKIYRQPNSGLVVLNNQSVQGSQWQKILSLVISNRGFLIRQGKYSRIQ